MKCPRCAYENLEGARFCSNCGNQLEIVCPNCSERSPAEAKFCWNCGNALAADRSGAPGEDLTRYVPPEMLAKMRSARSEDAMRGERRTVTMLFADIQGSTAAAEGLDPEEWADIINGAFEHLIAPVYRYEGTLARLQGDAVLAFFGAPIAHEDDPVRAVRAGLEIIEAMEPYQTAIMKRWELPIAVRVGINTGLVVVGEVGSDLRVEYTALGDAVNVAARMEQTAEPGTVRVTEETWRLVSDRFEAEELGPVEVKGKSEPVMAYRVLALASPAAVEAPERVQLVGRSEELETLERLVGRTVAGAGWLASIMGDAGVGKTRLLREFRDRTGEAYSTAFHLGQDGEIAWLGASSQSYDSAVPYATIRDLLERWWGLDQVEDPFGNIEKAVEESSLDDLQDAAIYLGHVAGVSLPESANHLLDALEPPLLQSRSRKAVVSYLEAESSRHPLLVALEDIHWADAMTLALLEDLMSLTDRASLGLVFTMRPYRDEPTWHIHEVAQRDHPHRYQHLELVSLGSDATEELLDELLEGVEVPEQTRATILKRSDGNPLFIYQMARAIRDGGAEELSVPTGLMSLLTARLDKLDEGSRIVAQMASVIGSEFDRPSLAALVGNGAVLDQRINDLLRREIFAEQLDVPGRLGFHHALMQEAAYSTMLLRTRRELHGRVAEYLMGAEPHSVEEIALHFVEAGDMESAFPHLVAAGEKTARAMALSESIRFFATALDNIPPTADPELVLKAHDGLGVAYALIPDLTQTEATYQRLVDYADTAGRPSDKVKALNQLAMHTATISGDLKAARQYLDEAYAVASEVGDEFGLAEYHMNACAIAGLGGDLWSSAHHDEETIKVAQQTGSDSIRLVGMSRLAESTAWLLDFDRAIPAIEEALKEAEEAGDEATLAHIRAISLGQLRLVEGDVDGALQLLEDNVATLVRYGDFEAPIVQWWIGDLLLQRGEIELGISRIAEIRREAKDSGAPMYEATTAATLARIYAWLGIEEPIAELRTSSLDALQRPMGEYLASTVWADLGFANLALGNAAEAEEDFRIGREVASANQYWERPRLLVGRAMALCQMGEYGEGHRCLDEAQTFVLEKGVRFFDAHIAHGRGEVLLAEAKAGEAMEKLTEAREVAEAARLKILELEIARAMARAALAAGDEGQAGEHAARARAIVEEMAGSIVDEQLRSALESTWLKTLDQLIAR